MNFSDFGRNLTRYIPKVKRKFKEEAVPSMNLPKGKNLNTAVDQSGYRIVIPEEKLVTQFFGFCFILIIV